MPEAPKKEFEVVAVYDYPGMEKGDLALKKGERIIVFDDSREHWWRARNNKGQVKILERAFEPKNGIKCSTHLHYFHVFFLLFVAGRKVLFPATMSRSLVWRVKSELFLLLFARVLYLYLHLWLLINDACAVLRSSGGSFLPFQEQGQKTF